MTDALHDNLNGSLHRRVARLLLLHDRTTFRGQFREWYARSTLPPLPALQAYDYLIRLLLLSDELLEELLPRIQRQMSFQATHTHQDEEPPLRGQIDWAASLQRASTQQPGQPPLRFATRQRSRTAATPENHFLAAVLASYARALRHVRTAPLFAAAPLTEAEQQELAHLEDRVRRELAAPDLQAIVQTLPDDSPEPADLAEVVEQRLPPGSNPYRDLLDWWRRCDRLHLRALPTPAAQAPAPVLISPTGNDDLYRLWLVLELIDMLAAQALLTAVDIQTDWLAATFAWQERAFRLSYARHAAADAVTLRVARAAPLHVSHNGQSVWHEPDVLLDAAIEPPAGAAGAADALVAALQRHDAVGGVLVLATLAQMPQSLQPPPEPAISYRSREPAPVWLCALRPLQQIDRLHTELCALLDQVTPWLPERPPVTCHGTLQDTDTVNPGGLPPLRCPGCATVLAICPKPHVGPTRVDLVCPRCDCLQQPRLCHILDSTEVIALIPPFVRRVLTREQLAASAEQMRTRLRERVDPDDESAEAEYARSVSFKAIGELTESYLAWKQPDTLLTQIEDKLTWVLGMFWHSDQHPRGLPEDVRHMLISGEYVWNEFQQTGMHDWAACAVQYVRAMERELHRRLYERCGKPSALRYYDRPMLPHQFTFGSVSRAYRKRQTEQPDPNWQTLCACAADTSGVSAADFTALIADITRLRRARNKIAHSERIDKSLAGTVRNAILGQPGAPGVLRRFVELLDPASATERDTAPFRA